MKVLAACGVVTFAVLYWLLFVAMRSSGDLRLSVYPRMALAPADLAVTVRLIPAASDRALSVALDSEAFSRSSAWTIPGAQAPRSYRVEWKAIPSGAYVVDAAVVDQRGQIRASDRQTVDVR